MKQSIGKLETAVSGLLSLLFLGFGYFMSVKIDPMQQQVRAAMLSQENQDWVSHPLANRALLDEARDALQASSVEQWDGVEESKRKRAVEFISHALKWVDNPERDYAARIAVHALLNTQHVVKTDVRLRESMSENIVSLASAFMKYGPADMKDFLNEPNVLVENYELVQRGVLKAQNNVSFVARK